ncbi:DUF3331 domain-containing protein [Paraburkholderia rhizosphaerae]|uniref:Uncharacterized protein DUF3331 n=1 Tax=Paraburkholderia rhizosphaerae TaxID=480658 RepID=A0A4R8LDB9_9BURK|nr:DUF3331 domain-containing protein [Paraburkholderia rhizosphaerae]TDY40565.1 uncharacterized protein DUF3331 [Paraburkholderia rhizosphaerae]
MSQTGKDELIARALVDLVVRPTRTVEEMRAQLHRKWAKIHACGALVDEADARCTETTKLKAAILGRLSPSTIAVRWSDSRSGAYGEQTWRIGRACRYSRCAATGLHIQPGDAVFKPVPIHYKVPFNGNRMILASAVESNMSGEDGQRAASR